MSKYIVRGGPPKESSSADSPSEPSELPPFDIEKLLSHGGEVLRREISHLMRESAKGKLNAGSARDLVAYIRLLQDVKEQQLEELGQLTDAELEAKLREEK